MAITFVNNALGGTTTTTSFSITLPATQADDIIILEYTHRGTGDATLGGTYSGPAFAEKHDQQYASSTFSGKTLWSRATGNHTGQTVTGSGLTDSCAAIITIYRGCTKSTDPLSDATVVGEQNASGNETQAQITNVSKGAWVVLVVVNSPDLAVSTQSSTDPGTLTERAEVLSTGGTDSSISHASAEKLTAGGTGSLTWSQTNAASGSWAYALMPEVAITPPVGALTVGGVAPVVDIGITPPVAALTLSGIAPSVSIGTIITPDAGALSATGQTPVVVEGAGDVPITPPTGIAFFGLMPFCEPTQAALALAGQAPTVIEGTVRGPGAGALTLTGNAPTTALETRTAAGALVLAGVAPVVTQGTVREPQVGALALTGQTPVVTQDVRITPPAGALVLAGNEPGIQLGGDTPRTPGVGSLVLTGAAPAVAWTVTPGTGALTVTGAAPTLQESTAKEAPSGALTLAGQAPAVVELHVRTPAAAASALTGAAPQVVVSTVREPGAGVLSITGIAPLIQAFEVRQPGAGALVLSGGAAVLVEPPFGEGWKFATHGRRRAFTVPDRELVGASHGRPMAFAAPERGED